MIKREDFFEILQTTLNGYYNDFFFAIKRSSSKNTNVLYIYDKLNAIVDINPSKQVRDFLKTEYSIKGSFLRKSIVNLYLNLALSTKGLFSLHPKLLVSGTNAGELKNLLIYPCNKKIRIFDFSKQVVNVITKSGFPDSAIKKEIDFRASHIHPNIEPVLNYGENWYCEKIIDGKPLARIHGNEDEYCLLKNNSFDILRSICRPHRKQKNSQVYINELIIESRRMANKLLMDSPVIADLESIFCILMENASGFDQEIWVSLSHGDFHHGNIWIENGTKRIVVIDWETHGIRSEWYDEFTLYCGLREIDGIKNLLTNLNNNSLRIFSEGVPETNLRSIVLIILLEDLKFRIDDLLTTPLEIGIWEFENFCNNLLFQLKNNF